MMLRILGALFLFLMGIACLRLFKKGGLISSLYDTLGLILLIITIFLDFDSFVAKLLAFIGATLVAVGLSLAVTKESGKLKKLRSANSSFGLFWARIPPNMAECRPTATRRDAFLIAAVCFLTSLGIVFIPVGNHLGVIYFLALVGFLTVIQSLVHLDR